MHDGISERVAIICQYLGTFFTGFILAYARSWRLALALSSIFPVIMVFGGIMFVVMTKISTASLDAIAKAGSMAEEVVGSIRTAQAFGTAQVLGDKFQERIEFSRKVQNKGSPVEGGGLAVMCEFSP